MTGATPAVDMWDERYSATSYFYGTAPNDFVRERHTAIRAGGDVLCIGEGEGRNSVFLAEQGYRPVALDQSAVGLTKARQLAAERGVHLDTIVADLADFEIESGRWDAIVSIWCHLPRELRAEVHRKVAAALKVGGVFLLEAYTPEQLKHGTGGPKTVDLLPTLAELRTELAPLDLVYAEELERMVHEGTGHEGLSAVVQIVAIRRA